MRYLLIFLFSFSFSSYVNSNELTNKSLICNADDLSKPSLFAKYMGFEFKNRSEVIRYQEPFYFESENQIDYKPRKTKLKYNLRVDRIHIYNDPKIYNQKVDYWISRNSLKFNDVIDYTCEVFSADLNNYFQERIDTYIENLKKKRKL